MRRNIVIIGIIISAIAVFMFIIGMAGYGNATKGKMWDFTDSGRYDEAISTFGTMGGLGFILLFVGIPVAIIGAVMKSKEQKTNTSERYCTSCGRSIPFDAKICPYCGKNFEQKAEVPK